MRPTPGVRPETLCFGFRLTRRDGVVLGFTDHDVAFDIDGVTYESQPGIDASAVEVSTGPRPDTQDIEGSLEIGGSVISLDSITREDLLGGLYQDARIDVVAINWASLPPTFTEEDGIIWFKTWVMGGLEEDGLKFKAELLDLLAYLNIPFGKTTSQTCRARLGDGDCAVNLAPFTVAGTVSEVVDEYSIVSSALGKPDGYFDDGKIMFSTGNMQTQELIVAGQRGDNLVFVTPSPLVLTAGDVFTIVVGCDKSVSTCAYKFDNIANFRGEPYLPGQDRFVGARRRAEKRDAN